MLRALLSAFDQYVKLNKTEILTSLARVELVAAREALPSGVDEVGRLADTVAAHLPLKLEQKQQLLGMFDVKQRLEHLLSQLETEIDILQAEKRIRGRVKRRMRHAQ
jgi:ATP-dependent Lon protease